MNPNLTYDRVAEALLSHSYRFAKSMPQIPHWYSLRKEWDKREWPSFSTCVNFIRQYGYTKRWGPHNHTYLDINGQAYWTMGSPIPETILINRGANNWDGAVHPYDEISEAYDSMVKTPDDLVRDDDLFSYLPADMGDLDVLDIGCGTGLALDRMNPRSYVGLDPSDGMTSVAKRKHGMKGQDFITCGLERFWMPPRFDVVISMYGSLNYVTSDSAVRRATQFVHEDGGFLFVLYKDGYRCPADEALRRGAPITYHDPAIFGGEVIDWGNYWIVRGNL